MRKVNLLRCDIARDASMQDLFSELSDTRVALSQAYARFNAVCEPELVDACVYEINAELSRYDYLLRQIKERGGRAVCKTCSEGAVKWESQKRCCSSCSARLRCWRCSSCLRRL